MAVVASRETSVLTNSLSLQTEVSQDVLVPDDHSDTPFLANTKCLTYSYNALNIVYFNARSLLPKLDELKCIAAAESPDVICIVETWLSGYVCKNEIATTD